MVVEKYRCSTRYHRYLKELDAPMNLQLVFELGGKAIRIFRKSKALWKTQLLDPKNHGWKNIFFN